MRRISIALLCLALTTSSFARDRDRDGDRDFFHFLRQVIRHFIGASTSDNLTPPKPCPPEGC
jgi:hypothetical protein